MRCIKLRVASLLVLVGVAGAGPARADEGWQLSKTLAGHNAQVRGLLFAPDGKTLFSGALDGTIKRWDTARGKGTPLAGHRDEPRGPGVFSMALSADGKTLASGGVGGFIK